MGLTLVGPGRLTLGGPMWLTLIGPTEFVRTYRFGMTDDYRRLIARELAAHSVR